MKRRIRWNFGWACGAALVLAALAAISFRSWARDTNAMPRFEIQDTPVERELRGVTSFAPIVKKAAPSVVYVYSTRVVRERSWAPFNEPWLHRFFGPDPNHRGSPNARPRTHRMEGLGSGVIVSPDGYILTANHVVEGADEIQVKLATDGREFTARVVGTDPPTDVAVLRVNASNLPAITITDSDKLEVGDVVLAIGDPFGVGQTVTTGIISALSRGNLPFGQINDYENFIQTDAAINPGNSGGALVDAQGRLVGINTAIVSGSGSYEGVGFAVPVNLARSVMERLIKYGKVTRGSIGVRLQEEISPELAQEFKLPDTRGAMISEVLPNTPAARAGLQNGDVIRQVDGKSVEDMRQLRLTISQTAPGTKVTLGILRSEPGKAPVEKSVEVTLGVLPEEFLARSSPSSQREEVSPSQDSLEGVEVSDLDADSRRELEVPRNIQGALVTNVEEDSGAANAGLREGDVILEINRQRVRDADAAVELSKKAKGSRVVLRIWREGTVSYLTVENK